MIDIPDEWPKRIAVQAGDSVHCVHRYGDPFGRPVVAFHGAPACRTMFALAEDHARRLGLCLYAPDRPGYGLSPIDATPSLRSRTEAHLQLADALALDRFAILGISGGAPYAVALAARAGPRASALVLVSPMGPVADLTALPVGQRPRVSLGHHVFFQRLPLKRRWLLERGSKAARRLFLEHPWAAERMMALLLGGADRRLLMQRGIADRLIAMTRDAVAGGMDGALADLDVFARPWEVDFAAISTPAVLWQGSADHVVPAEVAFRLARLIPGCRLRRLEGAGHFWVLGRIPDVLAQLCEMLGTPEVSPRKPVATRAGNA